MINERQISFLRVFKGTKAFARKAEYERAGYSEFEVTVMIDSLIESGFLKKNKAGAISSVMDWHNVTAFIEAQKKTKTEIDQEILATKRAIEKNHNDYASEPTKPWPHNFAKEQLRIQSQIYHRELESLKLQLKYVGNKCLNAGAEYA